MNLLIVSSWLPYPLDNGSRIRAFHLIRHLARRHAVTLLSVGHAHDDLAPLREFCSTVEVAVPTPVDRRRLGWRGLLSPAPRHLVQTESPTMKALISRYAAGQNAAVAMQIDAARYLRRYPAMPKVFEEVEVALLREQYLNESQAIRRFRHGLTWWKFRRYLRRLVHEFEYSTVVSDREREHLRDIGCDPNRVSVVPNGVEFDSWPRLHSSKRAARLIYPGAVSYFANLDAVRFFVQDIFPLVRRARPDVEFWVTGSTENVDVSDLMVPGVTFTGRLPEVASVIAESAVCVVPLRMGGGTRLKVLQAMACSAPVVSTTKGVEGLKVEAGRHLMVADSPKAFADHVLKLLNDASAGRRLTRAAAQVVRERYEWSQIGDALEHVVQAAVDDHNHGLGKRVSAVTGTAT